MAIPHTSPNTPTLSREDVETLALLWAVQQAPGGQSAEVTAALKLDASLTPAVEQALNRLARHGWLEAGEALDGPVRWQLAGMGREALEGR